MLVVVFLRYFGGLAVLFLLLLLFFVVVALDLLVLALVLVFVLLQLLAMLVALAVVVATQEASQIRCRSASAIPWSSEQRLGHFRVQAAAAAFRLCQGQCRRPTEFTQSLLHSLLGLKCWFLSGIGNRASHAHVLVERSASGRQRRACSGFLSQLAFKLAD